MTEDTSVDAHHAGNAVTDRTNAPSACGSVDAHHAAAAFTDTTLALMSYNIGINNNEVKHRGVLVNLCTKRDIKVQHLILQHANTSET